MMMKIEYKLSSHPSNPVTLNVNHTEHLSQAVIFDTCSRMTSLEQANNYINCDFIISNSTLTTNKQKRK